ncbi:MAG: GAF domain-containing sensor histidine kinase [Dehalococcoidaceae bacterium]|nr:GAF domain-containing sensor histidine kinase [Dehalococcoidaceae bacterium]
MRNRLSKVRLFNRELDNLRLLKIITVAFPPVFILLLEFLRRSIARETGALLVLDIVFFIVLILAAFGFSQLVFSLIKKIQKNNMEHNRELSILNEISQTMNESLDIDALLRRSMEKLITLTAADSGCLFLANEKNTELARKLHVGASAEIFKPEFSLLTNDSLISEVARSNEPLIIRDVNNLESAYKAYLAEAGFRSMAITPLMSRSGTVGVLALFSFQPGKFQPEQSSLFAGIGNKIAVAVENARLYEKVQASAIAEERERISKELHDGLAQVLGYVITKSQATRQILRKIAVAADNLVELENVAQDVYTDTREDILGLRTAISGDHDMITTIREYLALFSQMHGMKVTLEVSDRIVPPLSQRVELQAIRIMQEALSNIRKHAEATRAQVKLSASDDEIVLIVQDDGKGFDVEKADKNHEAKFGIRTIRERAESINSRLVIESRPEHGTRVTLSIPLNSSQAPVEQEETS